MAKLKKNRNIEVSTRDIFPRRAKETPLVNLDHLAVIMEIIDAGSGTEDQEKQINMDCKRESELHKTKCKKKESRRLNPKRKSSAKKKRLEKFTGSCQRNEKQESNIMQNTGGLSHFMELGARTDLLCDSATADPLGPDSFDNFQWVEVKQELPDDIEVCKVTFTELPLKKDCLNITDVKTGDDNETGNNGAVKPVAELEHCYKSEDEDKANDTSCSIDEKEEDILDISLDRDESSSENSGDDEFTEMDSTENIEENPPQKKRKNYPQQCDICDKTLYSKGNLRLHKLKKHKLKVHFTCELCALEFELRKEAVQHRNIVHRGEDGRFGCGVCNKRILDYRAFLVHVGSHSDRTRADLDRDGLRIHQTLVDVGGKLKSHEKNFICDTCGRRFAFGCLLRDHINTHTGAKPYLCQECGKAFCQKATLKQHTKTHSDVRPYQCCECPQGFYSKGDFVKHRRKHTGERPYVCEVCGEGFSRSTHLVIHRRTHTGERPHVCDICDRGFTKRGDVVRHRRVHTGELPYLCQVCGKAFRQSTQCANHIKSQHPDSPAIVARNPNPLAHVQLV